MDPRLTVERRAARAFNATGHLLGDLKKEITAMRILIVDDATVSAELTAECLMMEPCVSVQIAGDGATALRTMAEFQPDAVLLDVDLPDASGLDLAPQLKTMNEGRAPRIIIFSGSVRQSPGFLPDGVDAWLTKPAHLDALLDCIFRPDAKKRGLTDRT